jgi:hypothetical protein
MRKFKKEDNVFLHNDYIKITKNLEKTREIVTFGIGVIYSGGSIIDVTEANSGTIKVITIYDNGGIGIHVKSSKYDFTDVVYPEVLLINQED